MNPYVYSFANMDGHLSHHIDGVLRGIEECPGVPQEVKDRNLATLQIRLMAMLIDEVQSVKVELKMKELAKMKYMDLGIIDEQLKGRNTGPLRRS